jgi:hypothetical protein
MKDKSRSNLHKLCGFFIASLFIIISPRAVFASNIPDINSSNLQAATSDGTAGQAPADGKTVLRVTVTMKDAYGTPLSGEAVKIVCKEDITLLVTPSSLVTDSAGKVTFSVTAINVGTYAIDAINLTQNVTLTSLGRITFYSPLCNDTPPGSAPKLISATAISGSKILLKWTPATDPVTYYLLTYGTSSGQYTYGSANIGGHDATSYTVGSLVPNKKYYFKIRAGNGCSPGSFSNETSGSTVLVTTAPIPETTPAVTAPPTPRTTLVPAKTQEPNFDTPTPLSVPENTVTESPLGYMIIGVVILFGVFLILISLFFYMRRT